MEEKEYEFVHETIKKKPVNKKKLLRRTVLTAALAVVFGLVACVTFLLIEPVINNVLNPEKISKVEFPEEKKEGKPQELLTEESVARQEVQRQEAAVEEAKEEAIQSATTAFGIDQYKELYQDLYAYAQDSMDFMVSVIGISEMQDWLQGTFENENTTAGLILADNTAELLILADTESMENASQYYVRFCDKQMTEAHIKQKDSQTGLTILAVSKDEIYSTTMEEIRIAELGISGDDAIVGQPVIAIGAPQGTYGSVSYGMIRRFSIDLWGNTKGFRERITAMAKRNSRKRKNAEKRAETIIHVEEAEVPDKQETEEITAEKSTTKERVQKPEKQEGKEKKEQRKEEKTENGQNMAVSDKLDMNQLLKKKAERE